MITWTNRTRFSGRKSWNDHPFETIHETGCLTVWATSWFATVSDCDGNEFPPGRSERD